MQEWSKDPGFRSPLAGHLNSNIRIRFMKIRFYISLFRAKYLQSRTGTHQTDRCKSLIVIGLIMIGSDILTVDTAMNRIISVFLCLIPWRCPASMSPDSQSDRWINYLFRFLFDLIIRCKHQLEIMRTIIGDRLIQLAAVIAA